MFNLYPDDGLMPSNNMQEKPQAPQNDLVASLMEQLKRRMQEEAEDNDTFDHVPRAGDDVGA